MNRLSRLEGDCVPRADGIPPILFTSPNVRFPELIRCQIATQLVDDKNLERKSVWTTHLLRVNVFNRLRCGYGAKSYAAFFSYSSVILLDQTLVKTYFLIFHFGSFSYHICEFIHPVH